MRAKDVAACYDVDAYSDTLCCNLAFAMPSRAS